MAETGLRGDTFLPDLACPELLRTPSQIPWAFSSQVMFSGLPGKTLCFHLQWLEVDLFLRKVLQGSGNVVTLWCLCFWSRHSSFSRASPRFHMNIPAELTSSHFQKLCVFLVFLGNFPAEALFWSCFSQDGLCHMRVCILLSRRHVLWLNLTGQVESHILSIVLIFPKLLSLRGSSNSWSKAMNLHLTSSIKQNHIVASGGCLALFLGLAVAVLFTLALDWLPQSRKCPNSGPENFAYLLSNSHAQRHQTVVFNLC